jgi:predicted  nucleic acid-binding Zn-ribbon protein
MDLRNYAARETSALIDRLAAGASGKVAADLKELRQAFDMVKSAIESALTSQIIPDQRDEVAALAGRLADEAAKQSAAASEQVRKEAQAIIDQLKATAQTQAAEKATLATALKDAGAQVERLRLACDTQKDLTDSARKECARLEEANKASENARADLQGALDKARRDHAAVKDDLQAARKKGEATQADLASVTRQRDAEAAQREKLTAALSTAATKLQATEGQIKELLGQAKATASELEALRRAAVEHEKAARAMQSKLDESNATAKALAQRTETAERESKEARAKAEQSAQAATRATRTREEAEARAGRLLTEQSDTLRQHAGAFLSLSLDRLLSLDESAAASKTEDVLAAIVDALALQFSRVALFRVQSNRLEGVRQVGFDLQADISQVLIPRTLDSLVTQAVASAQIETRTGQELKNSKLPFGGSPEFGLALPVVIGDEPLAVVYADDSGGPHSEFGKPELRSKFAELVRRHAVPILARLVAEARVLAELDEYATLLLTELEQTYTADFEAAKDIPEAERRRQLKDNLDYARRLYGQRAEPEGARAAAVFEQRLFAAIESRKASPFGHDLAAVTGGKAAGARASGAR